MHVIQCVVVLVVCQVSYVKMVGATSSEGFLVFTVGLSIDAGLIAVGGLQRVLCLKYHR